MLLVLLLVVVIAWYSTYVVEPVVQSVILVERSPVGGDSQQAQDTEINSRTVEEVRQAVTQFLQQQQQLETTAGDSSSEHSDQSDHQEQVACLYD